MGGLGLRNDEIMFRIDFAGPHPPKSTSPEPDSLETRKMDPESLKRVENRVFGVSIPRLKVPPSQPPTPKNIPKKCHPTFMKNFENNGFVRF